MVGRSQSVRASSNDSIAPMLVIERSGPSAPKETQAGAPETAAMVDVATVHFRVGISGNETSGRNDVPLWSRAPPPHAGQSEPPSERPKADGSGHGRLRGRK